MKLEQMAIKPRHWIVPVTVFLFIIAGGIGSVIFAGGSPGSTGSYPERPSPLNQTSIVDFVAEYERVYAREELSRRYAIQHVSYDARNRSILDRTGNGYVVHVDVLVRWSGSQVEGDRQYVVNYFVNSSVIRRVEAESAVYPGPDPRTNGTVVDG